MADRQERVNPRLAIDDEVLALITQVRAARSRMLATVTTLNVQQERFKAGANEWSIANVVEHLVLAEQASTGSGRRQLTFDADKRGGVVQCPIGSSALRRWSSAPGK